MSPPDCRTSGTFTSQAFALGSSKCSFSLRCKRSPPIISDSLSWPAASHHSKLANSSILKNSSAAALLSICLSAKGESVFMMTRSRFNLRSVPSIFNSSKSFLSSYCFSVWSLRQACHMFHCKNETSATQQPHHFRSTPQSISRSHSTIHKDTSKMPSSLTTCVAQKSIATNVNTIGPVRFVSKDFTHWFWGHPMLERYRWVWSQATSRSGKENVLGILVHNRTLTNHRK